MTTKDKVFRYFFTFRTLIPRRNFWGDDKMLSHGSVIIIGDGRRDVDDDRGEKKVELDNANGKRFERVD